MRVCYLLAERLDFNDAMRVLLNWNDEVPRPPWDAERELIRALTNAFKRKGKA